ncbi:glycosyltransferase [Parasphingopyxis sp.]|uniref:glycosyltransferase n=1 Tax=Parasphingopyxis sp. TaxID=1920299 RepID=UPI00260626E7|nr:glycosyltransferase [Parasphingopyxis sp.]
MAGTQPVRRITRNSVDSVLRAFGTGPDEWLYVLRKKQDEGPSAELETLTCALARCGRDVTRAAEITIAHQRSEKRFADAFRLFRDLPEPSQRAFSIQREMAATNYEAGDLHRAVRWAASALAGNPDDAGALGILVVTLCRLGRLPEAIKAVELATPPSLNCNWALAVLFRTIAERADDMPASADARDACAEETLAILERKLGRTHIRIAQAYRLLGDYDRAADRLAKIRAEEPNNPGIDRETAELALASGRLVEHIDELRRILDAGKLPKKLEARVQQAIDWHDAMTNFYAKPHPFAEDYAVPDATFEMLYSTRARPDYACSALDVALVGATLAGGGAENALCNAHIALDAHTELSSQLWIYSLDPVAGHDFFRAQHDTPLFSDAHCIEIGADKDPPAPFCWLPDDTARHASAVAHMLKARRPKVVHAWQDSTNIEVALAAIMAGVPRIVIHPHNMRPDLVHKTKIAKSFRRAYGALLRRPDVELLCVSKSSLNDYRNWLELEETDRQHIIHNGFDWPDMPSRAKKRAERTAVRAEFGIDADAYVVGGMFRVISLKRPELWLETALRVLRAQDDAVFLLFGEGPGLPALRKMAAESGYGDRIILPGQVAHAARKCVAFDALLHTSSNEGLPTVALEAQAMGIGVVAADVGGVRETLRPSCGALVRSADSETFFQALQEWRARELTFDDERMMMRWVRDRFGLERMASELRDLYRRPLAATPKLCDAEVARKEGYREALTIPA